MIKKKELSSDDKKIWEDYLKNPTDLYDKDQDSSQEIKKKARFKFDLHGFSLVEANIKVKELILDCSKKKFKEILLITGKGLHSKTHLNSYVSNELSKLRYSVPEFIKSDKEISSIVISISGAGKEDGGEGAILIRLRNL